MTPTPKQREYLEYIRKYIERHGSAPAEHELQAFFGTTPPSVHQMIVTLTKKGLITRQPGVARSIRLVGPSPGCAAEEPIDRRLPSRPPDDITEPLDPPIAPLVEALRSDKRMLTKGSCWGHGRKRAYVELAVSGMDGLRALVERLNLVDRSFRTEARFELHVNWSQEVLTSCAFDVFPSWIMLSWTIEGGGRGGAPSQDLLEQIAKAWRMASKRSR